MERPILFSGPMVRAILAEGKTMTRRLVKPQPPALCRYEINGAGTHALCLANDPAAPGGLVFVPPTARSTDHRLPCPYGAPGDRLWCRETFAANVPGTERGVSYRADHDDPRGDGPAHPMRWRPSIFMRRAESRITLEVTSVRVERLQAITEDDASAEGVRQWWDDATCKEARAIGDRWDDAARRMGWDKWDPRGLFASLWDGINGKRAAWSTNPWVWVVGFRRVQP